MVMIMMMMKTTHDNDDDYGDFHYIDENVEGEHDVMTMAVVVPGRRH